MIRTVRSDELRPGDILSTNGARIESVVLCQGGGIPDELCVCYSFAAGETVDEYATLRFEYVDPAKPVHVWTPDEVTT